MVDKFAVAYVCLGVAVFAVVMLIMTMGVR